MKVTQYKACMNIDMLFDTQVLWCEIAAEREIGMYWH
jgi:hypothetical protein